MIFLRLTLTVCLFMFFVIFFIIIIMIQKQKFIFLLQKSTKRKPIYINWNEKKKKKIFLCHNKYFFLLMFYLHFSIFYWLDLNSQVLLFIQLVFKYISLRKNRMKRKKILLWILKFYYLFMVRIKLTSKKFSFNNLLPIAVVKVAQIFIFHFIISCSPTYNNLIGKLLF